jgi:uncharacterized protein DUF87
MAPPLWKVKPPLSPPKEGVHVGAGGGGGSDAIWFGTLAEAVAGGKEHRVWLTTGKEQIIAVVGKRGSGKSFTLGVIAEGLTVNSPNSVLSYQERRRAVLLFDPLDIYWTTRLPVAASDNAEAQRHYLLAKSAALTDISFSVKAWVPGTANSRRSDPSWFRMLQLSVGDLGLEEWELLLEVNILTDPMGQALVDTLNVVRTTGYIRDGTTIPPANEFDLIDLRAALDAPPLQTYHRETLRALRQRLMSLSATGLFSATGTTTAELLAPGQLSVVLLERLPQTYRDAVVGLITRMLIEDRAKTAFAEKRLALDPSISEEERTELSAVVESGTPRTVVALDEAQAFLARGATGPARELFVRLVKEGRNIGLSALIATQQPSAIDQRVLSQVETFITHQLVTEPDIRAVRDNLKSPMADSFILGNNSHESSALFRQLLPGQCLVSAADISVAPKRSIIVTVRPRATVHGGIEL